MSICSRHRHYDKNCELCNIPCGEGGTMTFNEWCERQENITARECGIALSAWDRQDENYAPLVEACKELRDDWSPHRVTAVIHALKAVKGDEQ